MSLSSREQIAAEFFLFDHSRSTSHAPLLLRGREPTLTSCRLPLVSDHGESWGAVGV